MSEAVEVYDVKIEPAQDIEQGTKAANALVQIVKKAGLAKKFGGEKEHLFVEAWEALGKFYGLKVRTGDANPVEVDGVKGAKARATLIDENTGHEAYCMRDEPNWKNKPFFQLASMAQTRAASKAFRMVLAFVPALAGYATTPAEEMDGVHDNRGRVENAPQANLASQAQLDLIVSILQKRVPGTDDLAYVNDILAPAELETINDLTKEQTRKVFDHFEQMKWTKPKPPPEKK
jgi:hypothetical protein